MTETEAVHIQNLDLLCGSTARNWFVLTEDKILAKKKRHCKWRQLLIVYHWIVVMTMYLRSLSPVR